MRLVLATLAAAAALAAPTGSTAYHLGEWDDDDFGLDDMDLLLGLDEDDLDDDDDWFADDDDDLLVEDELSDDDADDVSDDDEEDDDVSDADDETAFLDDEDDEEDAKDDDEDDADYEDAADDEGSRSMFLAADAADEAEDDAEQFNNQHYLKQVCDAFPRVCKLGDYHPVSSWMRKTRMNFLNDAMSGGYRGYGPGKYGHFKDPAAGFAMEEDDPMRAWDGDTALGDMPTVGGIHMVPNSNIFPHGLPKPGLIHPGAFPNPASNPGAWRLRSTGGY